MIENHNEETHNFALNPSIVKDFLMKHPKVLLDDENLLQEILENNDDTERKIFDLRGALIQRLETRLNELNQAYQELIHTTCANMESALTVQKAVLEVINTETLDECLNVIKEQYVHILSVDYVRLVIGYNSESNTDSCEYKDIFGNDSSNQKADVIILRNNVLEMLLKEKSGYEQCTSPILINNTVGSEMVYGRNVAAMVRSEAIIPINFNDTYCGAIIFASQNRLRFHEELSGELLDFLGKVVAITIAKWMDRSTDRET